jgi:hypothetical protein
VPVALALAVREAAPHRTGRVEPDEVEALRRGEHLVDDGLGRRQHAAAVRARALDAVGQQQVRIVGEVGQHRTQAGDGVGDRRAVVGRVARHRERVLGVTRAAHEPDRELVLLDAAGLPHLAAVQAREVGRLAREVRDEPLARRERRAERVDPRVEPLLGSEAGIRSGEFISSLPRRRRRR